MVILKNKQLIKIGVLSLVLVIAGVLIKENVQAAYYCRSEACKEAQAREQKYAALANQSEAMANSYQAAVQQLRNEIAMIESSIAANQALADDISKQIEETTAKLEAEQEALAEVLINMHFSSTAEPIRILAGSTSISDLAEKAAREEVAKQEIAAASEKVKALKLDLEEQKLAVESLIKADEEKKKEVDIKRAEQAALVAKYENDAASYEAEAAKAAEEKKQLMEAIAEETATCQYSGVTTTQFSNNYPYQNSCPSWPDFYPYAGMMCQCTSYAGWKAMSTYNISFSSWGNAKYWGWNYDGTPRDYKEGYRVDTVVEGGTVAVSSCGEYGHVMWVESVNTDGTINVSEYNNYGSNIYHRSADFGARTGVSTAGLRFIHFK